MVCGRILSATAAMTLVSFPVVEVAVLGLAVLGLAVPVVDRVPVAGLLNGYGAPCAGERGLALFAWLTGVDVLCAGMLWSKGYLTDRHQMAGCM